MTKYCAINLNAGYRLSFKYSRDDTGVLSKTILTVYRICICNDINLSKIVADDLLQCEKIENMVFIETDWSKAFVNGSYYSKLQPVKRTSAKQLFTNILGVTQLFTKGLCITSFTNLQIWKKWRKKEMGAVQTVALRNSKS